ncbi:hypothetical protein TNCV_854861 [Trichonephila clavipes]|nr:hypothetical protein TNCV_854861 [Trichonephila clavipes]
MRARVVAHYPVDTYCTYFLHRIISGRDVYGFASRVDQAMDVLRTDHSAVNGVKLYAQTLNDALQTECAVLWFLM